jgi:hypothetical protein
MGYVNQASSDGVNYFISTVSDGGDPASDPIPRSGSQQFNSKELIRSGNNAPWAKGGIVYTPMVTLVRYRAIISYVYVPRRRYRWSVAKNGRYYKEYYTIQVKKNIWGYKFREKRWIERSKNPDSQILIPNALNFYNCSISNNSTLVVDLVGQSGNYKYTGKTSGQGIMLGNYSASGQTFGHDISQYRTSDPSIGVWAAKVRPGVISRLYGNAMSNYANVANMLAEAGKTTDMVTTLLQSGINIARTVKRLDIARANAVINGYFSDARRLAREMSSLWLAWVYGASPLIDDINTIGHLAKRNNKAVIRFRARASMSTTQAYTTNPGGGPVSVSKNNEAFLKCQVLMRGQLSIPELSQLSGASTPLATIWESIPYSFILDQLYPLGDYLSNRIAFDMGVMSYHESLFERTTTTVTCDHKVSNSGSFSYAWSGNRQVATVDAVRFTRGVYQQPPAMPRPSFSISNLTWRRVLNDLALILQRT